MISQNKRLIGIILAVVLLLLLPLIAMQFTNEVNWSPIDFLVGGVLLLTAGLLCELVIRKVSKKYRIVICLGILGLLLLLWIELAVGLFGYPLWWNVIVSISTHFKPSLFNRAN